MSIKNCKECGKELHQRNRSALCKKCYEFCRNLDPVIKQNNKEAQKRCYEAKKQQYIKKSREWYQNNKEIKKTSVDKYREENKARFLEYQKEYKLINVDRLRECNRLYGLNRRKTDPSYALLKSIRNRTNDFFRLLSKKRNFSFTKNIGCSMEDLMSYMEHQFYGGMTWENRGKLWQVDHIRPLASFDLFKENEFKIACHYTNLQPLLIDEHKIKTASEQNLRCNKLSGVIND